MSRRLDTWQIAARSERGRAVQLLIVFGGSHRGRLHEVREDCGDQAAPAVLRHGVEALNPPVSPPRKLLHSVTTDLLATS